MEELAYMPELGMFEIEVVFKWTLHRLCWNSFKIIFSIVTALFPELLIQGWIRRAMADNYLVCCNQ